MSTAAEKKRKFIRYFREQTGTKEWNMRDVAEMAVKMGMPLPKPVDPVDMLAKQFADAAGEETREDKVTKKPYKANLAFARRRSDGKQLWLWFDVDDATRPQMAKGIRVYREQLVSGVVIGVNTVEHWNRCHPDQARLVFVTDMTDDADERRHATELEDIKAG
jgi:hypothetical protein